MATLAEWGCDARRQLTFVALSVFRRRHYLCSKFVQAKLEEFLAQSRQSPKPRKILCVFRPTRRRSAPSRTPSRCSTTSTRSCRRKACWCLRPICRKAWPVRFIDENIARATAEDFAWADAVMVSGMHVQAPQIRDIHRRAKAAGKPMALGGPSVSAAPEMYPDVEYLHIGEIGDATDAMIARLAADVASPPQQVRFTTKERLPLGDFPIPAYGLIPLGQYLIGSIQFSSGCPYQCEFCDIPGLYGRVPRLKSPEQIIAELECMLAQPSHPQTIYFVDDNFIGNRKAARDLLPHLVEWQKRRGFPLTFACEATLNIAKQTEILKLMRAASFVNIFVGIETPDIDALKSMRKEQNATLPMMESIRTLNSYGMEVTSGIILGLDTDTETSADQLIEFIEQSKIPVLTINLLHALPKTPLWDRLARANRITDDPTLESNVLFLRPYDDVVASWRRCIAHAYDPERLFDRFWHQVEFDLRQSAQSVRPRQADVRQSPHGRGAGVPAAGAGRHQVGLSPAFLARGAPCPQARPDRCRDGHGLCRLSPDPVHPRSAARRAECIVLLDARAGRAEVLEWQHERRFMRVAPDW